MRRLALVLLVACSKPTAGVDAGTPVDAKREVIVYEPSRVVPGAKTSKADEDRVIGHIFPKRVPCSGKQLTPAEAREAGEVAPLFIGAVKGAFTAAAADETAYLVLAAECGASHAADFGSHWLVIATGGQLGPPMEIQATSLGSVMDLDEDGESELVIGNGFTNQGITNESVKLVKLHGGKLTVVKDFGLVLDDNCGSGLPAARSKGKIIRALLKKGSPPEMLVEPHEAACRH